MQWLLNKYSFLVDHFTFNYLISPILEKLARSVIDQGTVRIAIPGCTEFTCGNGGAPEEITLYLHNPIKFMLRMLLDARMGLGESYMAGEWTAHPSLREFCDLILRNRSSSSLSHRNRNRSLMNSVRRSSISSWLYWIGQKIGTLFNYWLHKININSVVGSRKNIEKHYDLGNEMFALFLDKSMTYSSGVFLREEESLYDAQLNKLDEIIKKADIQESDNVLEIGCGWGSCGIRAAQKIGCKWTGLTISAEQLQLANDRIVAECLEEKIELKLKDYRHESDKYDKVVSIEMLEHVGHEFLPTYFQSVADCLKPGGLACIQSTVIGDAQYNRYINSSDFIRKHIFPGGSLPSVQAIQDSLPPELKMISIAKHGRSYVRTLDFWQQNWNNKKNQILALGYDETFFRKWQFYLCMSANFFANDRIDVVQIVLERN